jgi:hypothetical protein
MEQNIPTKPDVELPTVWTCAVQDLTVQAKREAEYSLLEQLHGTVPSGWDWIKATCDLDRKVWNDPATKKEYYELLCFFIERGTPERGASHAGLPVDRAQARLRVWLQLYDN